MQPKEVFAIVDIETVTDESLFPKQIYDDCFPPPIAHRPVCITVLTARWDKVGNIRYVRPGPMTTLTGDERSMLRYFSQLVDKAQPRLVSYNGRRFDLPVIVHRAMVHGLSMPTYFNAGDKWNCYTQRYSKNWHLDLMDSMTNYGACPPIPLGLAASSIGFPGKVDIDGSDVAKLYSEGKLTEIADYCELDVLNTSGLMLRWMVTTAELTPEGFGASSKALFDFIGTRGVEKYHIAKFGSQIDWENFGAVGNELDRIVKQPRALTGLSETRH